MPRSRSGAMFAIGVAVFTLALSLTIGAWLRSDDAGDPTARRTASPLDTKTADGPRPDPVPGSGDDGAPAVSSPPPTIMSGPAEIPITKLPLRLLRIAHEPSLEFSMATIRDLASGASEGMVEGQAFAGRPGVVLDRIERVEVLIDNRGTIERLPLDAESGSLASRSDTSEREWKRFELSVDERERRRALAARLRELTEAGEAGRDPFESEPQVEGLLAKARAVPLYEEGALVGVQLNDIEPGSLYERAGLQDGDVVMSINDVAFDAPMAPTLLVAELMTQQWVDVQVERADGRARTLRVSADELIEELAELSLGLSRD